MRSPLRRVNACRHGLGIDWSVLLGSDRRVRSQIAVAGKGGRISFRKGSQQPWRKNFIRRILALPGFGKKVLWFGVDVNIREYRSSDRVAVVECMERFGDYFVPLDPMKRTRRMPGYGEWFTDKMLEHVDRNQGLVYVVENQDRIVGFIAGIMPEQSRESLLECVPSKVGRVIELYLEEEFRGKGHWD